MRQWRLLACAGVVLACAGVALAAFGPAPMWAGYVNGDYVTGGNAGRTPAFGGNQLMDPFPVGMAWPGTVVKAWAHWSYLETSATVGTNSAITINGFGVAGAVTGVLSPDVCWGNAFTTNYTADVTGLMTAFGPGVYAVGTANDRPHAAGVDLAEGVSLLVVYDDGSPTRAVHVYTGATQTDTTVGLAPGTMGGWLNAYPGGPAHFFLNANDGQFDGGTGAWGDDFLINGTVVSGLLPGTGAPGDGWQGLLGPGPWGAPGTVQYDHGEGDSSPWMTGGDTALSFLTTYYGGGDCVNHSFGAISFAPEPTSLVLLALGGLAVLRRR
jgi:hypothetical protein